MKKGLFSILAGALLVVGCQNYDDQFSNIESQITALASQVAGLSQVQSDLTTLAGTVNALQANIEAGIGDTVDAALADGLADIDAAVVALEAATATAASSEDVAAIATLVAGQQEDLATILSASQFFQGDVTVNTVADLTTYHDARAAFKVINGNVTINSTSDMDMVKVQELVDAITQASLDYTYTAGTGVTTEITFNKLTSTRSLTLNQKGGYVLQNLTAATNISLDDDSTVDVVDLRGLKTVTSLLSTGDATGDFKFKKALELHLTALPYYTPGTLSLQVDEGSVIDITALRDVTSLGVAAALALTLDGPATVAITTLSGDKASSSLTLKNVANATLTGYDGAVTIGDDVKNFTSNGLVDWTVTGTDLVSVDVTGIVNPNAATADTKGPAVALTSQGDLTSVKLAGTILSVDLTTNGNLTEVIISGTVQDEIDLDGNSDLTTVTLTGSTMAGVTINNNSDLEALTIDTTFAKGTATTAKLDGKVVVTDNESLETLTVSSDKIETLTVTGNDDLVTINFTGVAAIGATGKPTVKIYDNDLTATKFTDTIDTTASVNGGATDIGTIASISGMSSLKTYLAAVKADADSTASVYFDTVDSFINEAAAESVDKIYLTAVGATQPDQIKVLVLTANTAAAQVTAKTAKRSYLYPAYSEFSLFANGTVVTGVVAANGNQQSFINSISTTAILAQAAAAGVTMSFTKNARPTAVFSVNVNASTMENSLTGNVSNSFAFGISDTFTMSVDGLSATITAVDTGGLTADTVIFVNAIVNKWNTAHALTAALARWTLATAVTVAGDVGGLGGFKITATPGDIGSREIGAAMSMSHSTTGNQTDTSVGYAIGNQNNFTQSVSDNIAQGTQVIVTVTANTAGSLLSEIGKFGDGVKTSGTKGISTTSLAYGVIELTSTYNANITASAAESATNSYVAENRTDVTIPAELVAAATSTAVAFSRVGWL